jgi:hypothetical protein
MFSAVGSNYRQGLQLFFETAPNFLGVQDPAGHSGALDDYLSFDKRQALLQRLSSTNERAKKALAAEGSGDHETAKRLWAIELGEEFPVG